ncbi:hypothetical protein [Qipengyuania sphaerica]|uniref:hypothetical protein n=1 Tax=Qipengyuania sphaerica TaxID=2867243 RepID=UPI001C86D101|nr:hypothetical protein [Qipengyuania sphaerica]MBX7540767.1 hypothetical protein [Qipengyuania sphaerica]
MAAVTQAQVEEWQEAVGREKVEEDVLDPRPLRRFAQALGLADESAGVPLAHWAYFLPSPLDSEIGPDGHPRRGDFLPDVSLPRRMFAGSSIEVPGDLEIGAPATQTSRVAELTHKAGKSGDLVFAKVEKHLEQEGTLRVREVQTYVYRDEGAPIAMPQPAPELPEGVVWEPDEVNLFRFSAATANGHRIHYDQPYATEVEGYPALIVHGPFIAAKLAGLAMAKGSLASFSFRAMAPLFVGQPIVLKGTSEHAFEAIRCDGVPAMAAQATYR